MSVAIKLGLDFIEGLPTKTYGFATPFQPHINKVFSLIIMQRRAALVRLSLAEKD